MRVCQRAGDAILVADDSSSTFDTPEGPITAVDHVSLRRQRRASSCRSLVLPAAANPRCSMSSAGCLATIEGASMWPARQFPARTIDRHGVPGRIDLPVAHGHRRMSLSRSNSSVANEGQRIESAAILSSWSASTASKTAIQANFRAACASASLLPEHSRPSRKSC